MKMKRLSALIIAVTLCLMWGFFPVTALAQKKNNSTIVDVPQDFKIIAISGGIAPGSPHYKIEIDSEGNGIYWEIPEDNTTGTFIEKNRFTVEGAALRFLYSVINNGDFFTLKEEYMAKNVLDGSYAKLTITADKKTHTVRTRNQAVKAFDDIMLAVNVVTPPDNKIVYNEILK